MKWLLTFFCIVMPVWSLSNSDKDTDLLYEEYVDPKSTKAGALTEKDPLEKRKKTLAALGLDNYNSRLTLYLGPGRFYNNDVDTTVTYSSIVGEYNFDTLFSVFARVNFPLTSRESIKFRTTTFTPGANLHYLRIKHFDFYVGGGLGYAIINVADTSPQAEITGLIHAGINYDFRVWHMSLEYNSQFMRFNNFDLSQGILLFGTGFKFTL